VADLFEDLLLERRAEDRCSLRCTRGAEDPATTGESNQVVRTTLVAVDAGKTAFEVAARLERENDLIHAPTPKAVGLLEALLPADLDPLRRARPRAGTQATLAVVELIKRGA